MPIPSCVITEKEVTNGFLAAPPLIAEQIANLTVTHPIWTRDLPKYVEFPRGNGTTMQQLVFRGSMPQTERGFDKWKHLQNNTGCEPCQTDCSYNVTQLPGTGLERKLMTLMSREFRSPSYCVKDIQTTAHFQEVFAQIVTNLYAQIDYIKDQNIAFNALVSLAKKYVVDSAGPKPNRQNPYVYRPLGSARVSMLNIELLEYFYEWLRRIPDAVPYDVIDGAPIYSLLASNQLLSRLYRDDPNLRQDVRFSGLANDLLMKYNFMSTIRGMYIAAPILYPRRFNIDGSGNPVEVFPYVNGIPLEVGSFTGFNPDYEAATHEEVIIHGKYPFSIYFMPTEETLGQNTSFGPEFSFMNSWAWINPLTVEDPLRRVGFFFTGATFGISQQFSDGIFAILVERPKVGLTASWLPEPACPPDEVDCANEVPDVTCPCPLITSFIPNPVTPGNYFVTLCVAIDAVAEDPIQLGIGTGGYVTGTVEAISADGKSVEVSFTEDLTSCNNFTTLFCDDTLGCYADVVSYNVNCTDNTQIDLVLSNPIKAVTNGDTVTVYFGDGSSASATVVAAGIDQTQNQWRVDLGATVFCDDVGGVVGICVPTATDSSCPDCGGPELTDCVT